MNIIDETNLNWRESLVLEKYSEKPWRPEELYQELERNRRMSRPTFYRAHRLLSDNFKEEDKPARRLKLPLTYVISGEEKREFGLVDDHGNVLRGTYYFRKDERKSHKWGKILQKIRDYNGKNSPYYFLTIIQREFSGYPLVSPEDVIEIARFHRKIPDGDLYNCERELFKFLEPQIRRLNRLLKKDERTSMSVALRAIFESCTKQLLGATETTVNDHSKNVFEILCYVYTEDEAKNLVESLFTRKVNINKEQADIRANLISDISEIFSKHYGREKITALLEVKIRELEDREIDLSFEDPKEMGNVTRLKNSLNQTMKKLNDT